MQPNQQEWANLYEVMCQLSGLDLSCYKAEQMQRRILGFCTANRLKSLTELAVWLRGHSGHVDEFLDSMAINVTGLFRNADRWEILKNQVIPELMSRSEKLKCWSAGCSNGAEAYSLAILLQDLCPANHSVMGTDIDSAALLQATKGVFGEHDMREVPKELRKYFTKTDQGWAIDAAVKKGVSFRKQNLFTQPFDQRLDLILCRNVVIYFTEEVKVRLYSRFYKALKPGGYLFVGNTERVSHAKDLHLERPFPLFYRKPLSEGNLWLNAS